MNEPTPVERPILFAGPMVRAILEGRKTQTRRVVRKQTEGRPIGLLGRHGGRLLDRRGRWLFHTGMEEIPFPFGEPGDRLWVRETFAIVDGETWFAAECDRPRADGVKFTPSIHMPRAASRIVLEVLDVRVEHLREISEEDARAEGVEPWNDLQIPYRLAFSSLWDRLNAGRGFGWDRDPFVWRIEFKRIAP